MWTGPKVLVWTGPGHTLWTGQYVAPTDRGPDGSATLTEEQDEYIQNDSRKMHCNSVYMSIST